MTASDHPAEREALLKELSVAREHIVEAIDGLDEEALRRRVLPSGWTCLGLVNHFPTNGPDRRIELVFRQIAHTDERKLLSISNRTIGSETDSVTECKKVHSIPNSARTFHSSSSAIVGNCRESAHDPPTLGEPDHRWNQGRREQIVVDVVPRAARDPRWPNSRSRRSCGVWILTRRDANWRRSRTSDARRLR